MADTAKVARSGWVCIAPACRDFRGMAATCGDPDAFDSRRSGRTECNPYLFDCAKAPGAHGTTAGASVGVAELESVSEVLTPGMVRPRLLNERSIRSDA